MKRLKPATIPPEEVARKLDDYVKAYESGDPVFVDHFGQNHPNIRAALAEFVAEQMSHEKVWMNDRYQVHVRDDPGCNVVHLSIKRLDKDTCHDWRDFQEIKNQLVGYECEAVELYPAESRVVDTANQYHLWCCKDKGFRFPFGFEKGLKCESEAGGSKQRKFEKNYG